MLHKPFGKTGKKISAVGCGGMRFANPQDIESNAQVVFHAYQSGVNYFDTGPGYCADKSEDIMGAAIQRMKPGTFYVSTKTFADTEDKLRADLERSLQRLHVPKIDFYHIWCITTMDAWQQRIGGVKAALKAKEQGLIDHLCVSSHLPGNELSQVLQEGYFDGVTLGYCAINFPYRQAAVAAAQEMGLGVIAMNPLGGGLIPQNAERFEFLRGAGDRSVTEAALRFVISNPGIASALVGFSSIQQVDQAVAAMKGFEPYSADRCATLRDKIAGAFDELCTGCGYCLPCPKDIDIPRMMDAYNQKLLGGDDQRVVGRIKMHWWSSPDAATICSLCGECEQKCTQHLPIRKRMKHIASLAEKKD